MATVRGNDSLVSLSGRQGNERVEGGQGEIEATRLAGKLAGILRGNYDVDFLDGQFNLDALSGEYAVDGIFGEFNVEFIEGDFVVGDQEREAFLLDLASRKSLTILLNRRDNNFLRDENKGQSGEPNLEMSFVLIRPEKLYSHGGWALVQVNIKNTGDLPAFDVLALNRIPEHASFLRFAKQDNLPQWLVRGYLEQENMLFWRLYQPLGPGETFKSAFAIKFDEWDVNAYSSDRIDL
jgi:hypothetical protein